MSRIPNAITGPNVQSAGRLPSPSLRSVTALSTTTGQGLGKGLERLGKAAFKIVSAVAERKQLESEVIATDQLESELSNFQNDNETEPLDLHQGFSQFTDEMEEALAGRMSPRMQLRINRSRRASNNILLQKQESRTFSTVEEAIGQIDPVSPEDKADFADEHINNNNSLSPTNKARLNKILDNTFSRKAIDKSIVAVGSHTDAKLIKNILDSAIESSPGLSPSVVRENVLLPNIRAASIEGDIDRVNKLSELLQGAAPDDQERFKALAQSNQAATTSAEFAVGMFTGRIPLDASKISSESNSRNKSFRAIRELGASLKQSAVFFMKLDNNLPKALITELKDEAAEGGRDNISRVVDTIRTIGRLDDRKASAIAETVGGATQVSYWASQAFNEGDDNIRRIIDVMSSPTANKILEQSKILFSGRTKRQGGVIIARNIVTRLSNAGVSDHTPELSSIQEQMAQGLFLQRSVETAINLGISDVTDIDDQSKSISRKVWDDLSQNHIDFNSVRFGIFGRDSFSGDKTILAESSKLNVGNVTQHDPLYENLEKAMAVDLRMKVVGKTGKVMPQNSVTEGSKSFIPAIDDNGDIKGILEWDRNTGAFRVLTESTDPVDFKNKKDAIISETNLDEFDPLAPLRYRKTMGDQSFVDINSQFEGALGRDVSALAERRFWETFGRKPDKSKGSQDRVELQNFLAELILVELGYPRYQDEREDPGGFKQEITK